MIGPSIKIKGEVTGEEDLLIQGRIEGTISLPNQEVSIGQAGRVSADIKARVVRIEGEVTGDITGSEKVVITKSGNVRGNIVAPRVTLEDGAWVLVRASSNKPELVVVVESMTSEADMRALFRDEVKPRLARYPEVGAYNQEI